MEPKHITFTICIWHLNLGHQKAKWYLTSMWDEAMQSFNANLQKSELSSNRKVPNGDRLEFLLSCRKGSFTMESCHAKIASKGGIRISNL